MDTGYCSILNVTFISIFLIPYNNKECIMLSWMLYRASTVHCINIEIIEMNEKSK